MKFADSHNPTRPSDRSTPNAIDWDDLRYVLAIADAGSLNAAARDLGVRHSTVLRRLDALEQRLGARLFERLRSGYAPTEAGDWMAEQARQFRPVVDELHRRILGRDLQLRGTLRVNIASIAAWLLAPALADFARAHPGIEVEMTESSELVDLSKRDADLVLRMSEHVPQHLVGRRLGTVPFAIYARRGASDLPQSRWPIDDLIARAPWIAFERHRSSRFIDRWMHANVPDARVVLRVDLLQSMVAMLRTGLGVGLLPRFIEPLEPSLVRVSDDIAALSTPLWLLTHPDLRDTARVRAFLGHVGDNLARTLARADADIASSP